METIHNILKIILSPEALQALGDIWAAVIVVATALLALVGAASALVVKLKVAARLFKAWAEHTEMKADDNLAMFLAGCLDVVGAGLDAARAFLEKFALNNAGDKK